jgi:hypothetical protein
LAAGSQHAPAASAASLVPQQVATAGVDDDAVSACEPQPQPVDDPAVIGSVIFCSAMMIPV